MKRIFPIISILIFLSLVGLIFFQYLWITSARDLKQQQLSESFTNAVEEVGEKLVMERNILTPPKKNTDILFPPDKLTIDFFNQSVLKRFNMEEIK